MRALGDVTMDPWNEHVPFRLHTPEQLIGRLQGVDVLIVEADFVTAEVFEQSSLRITGVCRGDPTNVDVPAATKHGVAVIRTPARNASAVAELTLALMLGLLRNVVAADADVRAGRWIVDGVLPQQRFWGRELSGCVVGLIGYGAIGREVARRLRALGVPVLAFDPAGDDRVMQSQGVARVDGVAELIARADIISVHAPLTHETRGMLGAAEFAGLKPGALFVNTARYGIADEQALLDALSSGRLAGAAFDHFENEFLPPEHPLTKLPNVILTPHLGGSTQETIENHTTQIARAIVDVLAGNSTPGVVNPEVLPIAMP